MPSAWRVRVVSERLARERLCDVEVAERNAVELEGDERDAAADAVVAGQDLPLVLVDGSVACSGGIDADAVAAAAAQAVGRASSDRSRKYWATAAVMVIAAVLVVWAIGGGTGGAVSGDADPYEAYEAALATGKPVVVFFHSLTCQPCVQMSATFGEVYPEYAGRVELVDVVSDREDAAPMLERFPFAYIPTTFLLSADGAILDQITGPIPADDLRDRLDALSE